MARKLFTSGETVTPTKINDATKPDYDEIVVIDTNSASAALRVTQTGTGDAILVEDSANPDSTPLVVNSIGQIISGATTAFGGNAGLQITADSNTAPNAAIIIRRCQDTAPEYRASLRIQRTRGSAASPSAVQNGDALGAVDVLGFDGSSNVTAGSIECSADGAISSGIIPARITLTTANSSGVLTERMRIDSSGNVGIGTASPNTSALLHLSSTAKGFLPPVLTTAQRDAISSPAEGLMIYNTATNKLNFYNGTVWEAVTSS